MKKRSLALFLALLMLAGCSNTQAPEEAEAANNTSDTSGTAETAASTETETEETEFSPVPDVTFDGEDFGVLYRFDAWSYSVPYIFVDELTGDVAGTRGRRTERECLAVPFLGNSRCIGHACDCIIPFTIQIDPIFTHQLRTRITAPGIFRCHLFAPLCH